jgi:hypothetical protein
MMSFHDAVMIAPSAAIRKPASAKLTQGEG